MIMILLEFIYLLLLQIVILSQLFENYHRRYLYTISVYISCFHEINLSKTKLSKATISVSCACNIWLAAEGSGSLMMFQSRDSNTLNEYSEMKVLRTADKCIQTEPWGTAGRFLFSYPGGLALANLFTSVSRPDKDEKNTFASLDSHQ